MTELVTAATLWDLLKHAAAWVRNLRRASGDRKAESTEAVREVVRVSRKTAVYIRELGENGKRNFSVERELSILWTDLGFRLSDLGLNKLAKKCDIKGAEWADPARFDPAFLEKADVTLDSMERGALVILAELKK